MLIYQGVYKVRNPKKYEGDHTNVVYRSGWERSAFVWCDKNPRVKKWSSEEIQVPYIYEVDKKYHRYFVDLKIVMEDGKTILVEIKPKKETAAPIKKGKTKKRYLEEGLTFVKNQNKWEAAQKYARKRGWEFQIWTEETLQTMGILPKQFKMKPLPKFKPYKRKKNDRTRKKS